VPYLPGLLPRARSGPVRAGGREGDVGARVEPGQSATVRSRGEDDDLRPGSEADVGLGIITARAVALVRKLSNRGIAPAAIERGEILEVYPRATLVRLTGIDKRLRPRSRGESQAKYRSRVLRGLEGDEVGLRVGERERSNVRASGHTLDAVIAAYTGWLHPDRLEAPPEDFNVAAGWIWFPKA
jgi:hypothetical protein